MKKSEIKEGNRIIAEFMKVSIVAATSEDLPRSSYTDTFETFAECQRFCDKTNALRAPNHGYIPIHPWGPMEYHSSWDWIMPAVQKILGMKDVDIKRLDIMRGALQTAHIDTVYTFAVAFIKWYNKKS